MGFGEAKTALVEAYRSALGARPAASELDAAEEEAIRRWETRFRDPEWLAGPTAPARPVLQVKISADASLLAAAGDRLRVEASIVDGRLERVTVSAEPPGVETAALGRALAGREARPEDVRRALEPFGEDGLEVLRLLEPGLRTVR